MHTVNGADGNSSPPAAHSRRATTARSTDSDNPYSPFLMGIQSYSLRGLTRENRPDLRTALAATKELGVHYWESYPAHVPMNAPTALEGVKHEMSLADVVLKGYGVVHFGRDSEANRRIFEFGKSMGITYFSADPDPAAFDDLDKLVETYGIAIGIHNHGPGHRYGKIETIAKAIHNHHSRIGCCIDTGHFLRSREDPVHAVEAFGSRVYGVHLKDVKDAETFTVLGRGDLRTVDFLKALIKHKYGYCLAVEYEEKAENPLADIKACLAQAAKDISTAQSA
jgi:sugar phosphate isomerase/epimerase